MTFWQTIERILRRNNENENKVNSSAGSRSSIGLSTTLSLGPSPKIQDCSVPKVIVLTSQDLEFICEIDSPEKLSEKSRSYAKKLKQVEKSLRFNFLISISSLTNILCCI